MYNCSNCPGYCCSYPLIALTKRDMLHNDALPAIDVDPETYRVTVDGELCTCDPVDRVPLGRLYVLK